MDFELFTRGAAMKSKQLLLSLSCAAVFAGCASTPEAPPPPPPAPPTMAFLLQQAEVAVKAGQSEQAVNVLKRATRIYPADKRAWLRIAQVSFDCDEYGDAITHAKKVLERDPDDVVAHSILAVSGLRVSSKALADLATKKRISGDVRDAAQDLAKILRTSIGGDIIPANAKERKVHAIKPGGAIAAVPLAKSGTESLIEVLNQPNDPGKK
jgi:tetratricopeptide (TPR) repeat protein